MLSGTTQFASICAQLIKDQEFASLTTNEERVSHIFKTVKSLQEFREELKPIANEYRESHGKSLKLSQKLRQDGDNHLEMKEYMRAIQLYTYVSNGLQRLVFRSLTESVCYKQ